MNSNAVCRTATNLNGYNFFNYYQRSVLCHPVGLPLLAAFHGIELPCLPSSYPVEAFPPELLSNEKGNTILSKVYNSLQDSSKMTETKLTKGLYRQIKLAFADQFIVKTQPSISQNGNKSGGKLDLAFLPKSKKGKSANTPLCVVEVGLLSGDWWKKLHQGAMYLQTMQLKSQAPYCFEEPMLLVTITVDDSRPDFNLCMGVVLCTPRTETSDFRMSLIWHKKHSAIEMASESFGLLLRILDHFQTQRSKEYEGECEYFSSNCIKVGDTVGMVPGQA